MNNIEILENAIKCNKKQFEEIGTHILLQDDEMKAIENLIKRNKDLEEMLKHRIKYTNELEKDLFENASNYVIPKSKVREKMEKDTYKNEHTILGGRRNGKTLEYGIRLGRIQMCEELLQEGDK